MMGEADIPEWWGKWLDHSPESRMILLLRHGPRAGLPEGAVGNDLPLLPCGWEQARILGQRLKNKLRSVYSSPVLRCVQTAQAILEGARLALPIQEDPILGAPGAYVEDAEIAWRAWFNLGTEEVIRRMVRGEHLEGFASPQEASRRLIAHLLEKGRGQNGIHLHISHDSLIAPTVAHELGVQLPQEEWPVFFEPLVLICEAGKAPVLWYRQRSKGIVHGRF